MRKYTEYQGCILESVDIDGKPMAKMDLILESIVPSGWRDYEQILNSEVDLTEDLQVCRLGVADGKPGLYIPVYNISRWLYTIKLRDVNSRLKNLFRLYRRDCEKSFRLTWAMPVGELHYRSMSTPYVEPTGVTIADLANFMESEGIELNMRADSALDVLYELAASNKSGVGGVKLKEMLEYIEDLPFSDHIMGYIEEKISIGLPESYSGLSEYLTRINTLISFIITQFFGERNAVK
jgi:hypothetical protein